MHFDATDLFIARLPRGLTRHDVNIASPFHLGLGEIMIYWL